MSKRLSRMEIQQIKHDLQVDFEKAGVACDTSPCIYRGWEQMAWCKDCKGWHEGCEARVPEVLYKNPDGSWRDD